MGLEATLRVFKAKRGPVGTGQVEGNVGVKSLTVTWAYGSQASPGAVVFVARTHFQEVLNGAWLEISVYGRTFYGVAQNGTARGGEGEASAVLPTSKGPDGREVTVNFLDPRYYLKCDDVFGAFNQEDIRQIDGRRVKRYWHIYPRNYVAHLKTWTTGPLTCAQIIDLLLGADTVETIWTPVFHPLQLAQAAPDFNFLGGRPLDEALADVSAAQGLVFTIKGGPFTLEWARKGEGALEIPAGVQTYNISNQISEGPSRVWVVGERNRYQVLDLTMTPDWNREYEAFFRDGAGIDGLKNDLYRNDAAFNAIAGDVEHAQGHLLAAARSKEITVREYAALRLARDAQDFSDYRLFEGRSRMDMPVALYMSNLVFRAYRPPTQIQIGTSSLPLASLSAVEEGLAQVTHNAETGAMNVAVSTVGPEGSQKVSVDLPAMGRGYAIVQGVGIDPAYLVEYFASDRFVPSVWARQTSLWRAITFSVDASGEDGMFILLDEALWKTGDAFKTVDGHVVMNALPTVEPAAVRCALCFEADRFRVGIGTAGGRDEVMNVGALRREVVVRAGSVVGEVVYGDGRSAGEKAAELAAARLGMLFTLTEGGYRQPLLDGDTAPELTGVYHRITVEYSASGRMVVVEFAQERGKRTFVPDGDMDREARRGGLFAGQAELKRLAGMDRFNAQDARITRGALAREVGGLLGGRSRGQARVTIHSGTGTLRAGTPLWRGPATLASGAEQLTGTQSVMPATAGDDHEVLAGVVVREDESAVSQVRVCEHGRVPARVKGPVSVHDAIGRVNGQDYFGKVDADGGSGNEADGEAVGRVEQAVAAGEVRLVRVWLGVGAGGGTGEEAPAVWS